MKKTLVVALIAVTACHRGPAPAPQVASVPSPAEAPPPGPGAVAPMSPADRPATAARASGSTSLYARLGGVEAIRAVVHDFVGRVVADDRINAFFRGVDVPHLEQMLTDQICSATGGPCTYRGKSMREVHTGMNLTDAHFNALVEDLSAALDRFRVQPAEKGQLLGALGNLKPEIVGH